MNKIVLDLETQRTFDEVGVRYMHLLGVSVVAGYLPAGIHIHPENR